MLVENKNLENKTSKSRRTVEGMDCLDSISVSPREWSMGKKENGWEGNDKKVGQRSYPHDFPVVEKLQPYKPTGKPVWGEKTEA